MKKFVKTVSLLLALVLAIGASAMPAFAATCAGCLYGAEDPKENYHWGYNADGTVKYADWRHTCSNGPTIFGIEDERDNSIAYVKNGNATVAYYMDAAGDLWTDMPKYGGTLIAKAGTAEYDVALYGKSVLPTIDQNYKLHYSGVSKSIGTPDTSSYGFTDVADDAWYANAVNALAHTGIIKGVGNSKFDPDGTITWQQMYWILERLLGVNGEFLPNTLHDDAPASFETEKEVVDMVLMLTGDSRNDLGKPVTRAEAIALVTLVYSVSVANRDQYEAYYEANGIRVIDGGAVVSAQEAVANGRKLWTVDMIPDGRDALDILKNFSSIDRVNTDIIAHAYTIGIVKGVDGNGTMNAAGSLTRAEFCQMLYNAGILGCVYPTIYSVRPAGHTVLFTYMETHRTDGTPVNG